MLSDFISLFFPRYCAGCHHALSKNEEMICITCLHEMPKTNSHIDRPNFIEQKFFGKIQLAHALAFYRFHRKGRIQRILHQLKYNNQPDLGIMLGKRYGKELLSYDFNQEIDVIIPVPLHKTKLRRRGYNQSAQFGEGLSLSLGVSQQTNAVKRIKKTQTQTRKSRLERWQNVDKIFEVVREKDLKDKRVLLVDDVITTGSTLESCAHTILDAGAKSVSIACIAAAA